MTVSDFIEKIDDDTYIIVRNRFSEVKGYLCDVIESIIYAFEYFEVDRMFIDDQAFADEANGCVAGLVIIAED